MESYKFEMLNYPYCNIERPSLIQERLFKNQFFNIISLG